ncbi:hypothetical protein [Blastopirellula retiformator]|uniref:Uncharacterized protein n=1 Tax=Blastopirellula retiformator TaxID=2527970 RepID=A0A5C5UUA7_9BACT|nr:hypothetical protein [Blastopirellula retiformator]TWT29876.1 hypothetical protein Enr8_45320 [Blastopirellula retiformator]
MTQTPLLPSEEYIEQSFFFQSLREKIEDNAPLQDILQSVREEILATTKLPMAIDFLLAELRHLGLFNSAMRRLSHYFAPYQTFLIAAAEDDRGRFDFRVALEVLKLEAEFRAAEKTTPAAMFVYQFEVLCRHRLKYDGGLAAMAGDPMYDENWRHFLESLRRRIGMIDLADLIYVRSEYYIEQQSRRRNGTMPDEPPIFGTREGRIALANRNKDPLLLFSALQRQLKYPSVPKPKKHVEAEDLIHNLAQRVNTLESRLKLIEEDQKGGFDLSKFYSHPDDEDKPNGHRLAD